MHKVLILGNKGNLGVQLVKTFSADCDIIAWDKEEIDITDEILINKKVSEIKPDTIINTAAYNAVDLCEESEEEFILAEKLNGQAVGYLAEAARRGGALLVHYSSDYVFSGDKIGGYKENDRPHPINKYGQTKFKGEQEIISRSGRGLKYYLIRTSKLFGPRGKSAAAKENFFDLILRFAKKRKQLDIIDKEEISCFTYTPDLALATKQLINKRNPFGIYHITNNGSASWYEAAEFLFNLLGIANVKLNAATSANYIRPAKRPKYSVLLNTKIKSLRNWQEALAEYARNYQL